MCHVSAIIRYPFKRKFVEVKLNLSLKAFVAHFHVRFTPIRISLQMYCAHQVYRSIRQGSSSSYAPGDFNLALAYSVSNYLSLHINARVVIYLCVDHEKRYSIDPISRPVL